MKDQYMLHLLPCTHQDDIRIRAKHFAIKADPSSCSRQGRRARRFRRIFHTLGCGTFNSRLTRRVEFLGLRW